MILRAVSVVCLAGNVTKCFIDTAADVPMLIHGEDLNVGKRKKVSRLDSFDVGRKSLLIGFKKLPYLFWIAVVVKSINSDINRCVER